jgi:hypothetical protein
MNIDDLKAAYSKLPGKLIKRGKRILYSGDHRRLDEFDGDFPDNFAPDILSAKFFHPLRVILLVKMRVFLRFSRGD